MTLAVRVIAPGKTIWDGSAEEVILPSTTGQLGVLSGHAPLLTALETGVMRVRADKAWTPLVLTGGFAEVDADEVTVLVNFGERGDAIDQQEARTTFAEAEARLTKSQQSNDKQEQLQASQAYKRARARLQASGGTV